MDKYLNKYRIPPARLQSWDYASEGMYFITICTKNREHAFGEIIDDKMNFSPLGETVDTEWIKTLELRPDMQIELGDFQVMPNHFHSILTIGANEFNKDLEPLSVNGKNVSPKNKFAPQSHNLSAIIRGFKGAITKFANSNNISFAWQTRFHDHIIRNQKEYIKISDYIVNNVFSWKDDKFYDSSL